MDRQLHEINTKEQKFTSAIDGRISGSVWIHTYAVLAMWYSSYVLYLSSRRGSTSSCNESVSIRGNAWNAMTDVSGNKDYYP